MGGVPVAAVIKAVGLFEDAGQLHAARATLINGSLGILAAFMAGLFGRQTLFSQL